MLPHVRVMKCVLSANVLVCRLGLVREALWIHVSVARNNPGYTAPGSEFPCTGFMVERYLLLVYVLVQEIDPGFTFTFPVASKLCQYRAQFSPYMHHSWFPLSSTRHFLCMPSRSVQWPGERARYRGDDLVIFHPTNSYSSVETHRRGQVVTEETESWNGKLKWVIFC